MTETEYTLANKAMREALAAVFQMDFSFPAFTSPKDEFSFLNYLRQLEDLQHKASRIAVYDYIGRPEFIPADLLEPVAATDALTHLQQQLANSGIFLELDRDYPPLTIYRCITEDLFTEEICDIRLPGLEMVFCYEDLSDEGQRAAGCVIDFLEQLRQGSADEAIARLVHSRISPGGVLVSRDEIWQAAVEDRQQLVLAAPEALETDLLVVTDSGNEGKALIRDSGPLPGTRGYTFQLVCEEGEWLICDWWETINPE
ncbi:hypothetical protein [Flavihumibacter petaseus]|uniref:Uncharacterized protein n=1 Tax=Flavihumibacter petaseus NBRC 106054 TaxID=1220578 RepID=A0A0E9N3J8_9BACT|nr:hypothetical protein [Flavihumibacter petaseus]GAO44261.1 hypothetical protein FPE01S_03_02990 [Flavihumibacter petaseus NBRC 106054]